MWHQLGQAMFFFAFGGLPWLVWGFVIRVLGEVKHDLICMQSHD
jgi:hypothetical protein